MLDKEGFRANVAIVISDGAGRLFWAKRIGQNAWQFPQGGIDTGESPEDALYRELYEEVGLESSDVKLLCQSKRWLRYHIPEPMRRKRSAPVCVGQKQKWYLLQLTASTDKIRFDAAGSPEFDGWEWVNYWYPVRSIVSFKKNVYRRALQEFAPINSRFELSRD